MCIYCGTCNYRKIYTSHFGEIPYDETGRSHEIHHIDKNRNNNDISNLQCVSIQEHYDIHYSQKDWGACFRIAAKMKLSAKELSEMSTRLQKQRVKSGTHHFLDKEQAKQRALQKVANGTHPFLGGNLVKERVKNGTHNLLGGEISKKITRKRLEDRTHNLLGHNQNQTRIENGSHNFLDKEAAKNRALKRINSGNHPFNNLVSCLYCDIKCSAANAAKYHNYKCKFKSKTL